jgi:hypothetical protein
MPDIERSSSSREVTVERPHAARWQGKTDAEIIALLEGRMKHLHRERNRLLGALHRIERFGIGEAVRIAHEELDR